MGGEMTNSKEIGNEGKKGAYSLYYKYAYIVPERKLSFSIQTRYLPGKRRAIPS